MTYQGILSAIGNTPLVELKRVHSERAFQAVGQARRAQSRGSAKGEVDLLFCATSTCGTITGCAEYVRDHGISTQIVAVDAVGSRIFSDVGAGFRPDLCRPELVSRCVHVSDCVTGCRRLLQSEGLLAGGSSGGVLAALDRLKDEIPAGTHCVMILPDRGERYLDTVYSDDWVCEHLGLANCLGLDQIPGRSFLELAPAS